ncbi:MAG: hypothetical protein IKC51_05200 [Myxococcaceae bacterium]|nr:hypothetical protein [Myxococcaceae bacterium]
MFRLPATRRLIALCLAALVSACAHNGPSTQFKREVQSLLAESRFDEAASHIDSARETYGASNAVLFHLDRAATLHDAGRYAESDQALDLAERRMDELYTRRFSQAAGRYFLHDATEDYAGEPYERALLHIYRALNHLFLGQGDGAAVEARKVGVFLDDLRARTDGALSYRDDAFAHLLSAMILEDTGELDNARIAWRQAQKVYGEQARAFQTPTPEAVLDGLLFRDLEAESLAALEAETVEGVAQEGLADEVGTNATPAAAETAPATGTAETGTAQAASSEAADAPIPETPTGNAAVIARAEAAFDRLEAETGGQVVASAATNAAATGATETAPAATSEAEAASATATETESAAKASEAATAANATEAETKPLATGAATASAAREGELVLLHYNGLMPHKVERRVQVAGTRAAIYVNQYPDEVEGERLDEAAMTALSAESIVVAFPELRETPTRVKSSWVQCLDGGCQVETALVSDIGAIAGRTLQERIAAIQARAIARAAIKFVIAKAAQLATYAVTRTQTEQEYAGLAGAIVGIIGRTAAMATEQADTRGWHTAPAQIRMARLRLPEGTHALSVAFVDERGEVLSSWDIPAAHVRAGQRTYLHVRTSF